MKRIKNKTTFKCIYKLKNGYNKQKKLHIRQIE